MTAAARTSLSTRRVKFACRAQPSGEHHPTATGEDHATYSLFPRLRWPPHRAEHRPNGLRGPLAMRVSAPALIATHLSAVAVGYFVTDKRPVDTEVHHDGMFKITTSKILATTVESLHDENKLLVFSYKGTAKVQTERTEWWIFGGRQELSVPAVVNYYIDLSLLSLLDVHLDERTKIVTVKLPKVILGDIAFQPENATTINGGILTWSEDQVEAMRKLSYASARRSMVAQAQQPGLLKSAQKQAQTNITNLFEIPLRIAGQPDIRVVATFK